MHKDGDEWDIARAVFDFPEVIQENNDDEVKDIFDPSGTTTRIYMTTMRC